MEIRNLTEIEKLQLSEKAWAFWKAYRSLADFLESIDAESFNSIKELTDAYPLRHCVEEAGLDIKLFAEALEENADKLKIEAF